MPQTFRLKMEKPSSLPSEDSIKSRLCQDDLHADEDSIPLADDDPSAVVDTETSEDQADRRAANWRRGHESLDSIPSMISDSLPTSAGPSSLIGLTASHVTEQMTRMCLDPDFSPDETEEKARLISQVMKFATSWPEKKNWVLKMLRTH